MKKLSLIFAAILMLSLCFVACDQNTGVEYSFSYNGTAVRIGEDGKALSAALGDYIDYRESGSCGAEQNDKEFYYPGFRYDTVWSNGADRIARGLDLADIALVGLGTAVDGGAHGPAFTVDNGVGIDFVDTGFHFLHGSNIVQAH